MSDLDMLKILKMLDSAESKTVLKESAVNECGPMPQESSSNVNISVTGNSMADIMRALANIESNSPTMAMSMDSMENEEEAFEDWENDPDEEYQDHEYMTKTLSGGLNREKKMYPPAAAGDNPMAVESIKDRLYRALNEKKSKDLSEKPNEGNEFSGALAQAKKSGKKEFEVDGKKYKVQEGVALSPKYIKHLQLALRNWGPELSRSEARQLQDILDKQSIANIKTLMNADIPHLSQMAKLYLRNKTPGGMVNYKEAAEKKAKPDFLDMDKDGDKKEPMKKAVADKNKAPVKEAELSEIDANTMAGLALLKMRHDAEKKYKDSVMKKQRKPSMASLAGKFDQETIAGLTRLKMKHDAEKKYKDSFKKK